MTHSQSSKTRSPNADASAHEVTAIYVCADGTTKTCYGLYVRVIELLLIPYGYATEGDLWAMIDELEEDIRRHEAQLNGGLDD